MRLEKVHAVQRDLDHLAAIEWSTDSDARVAAFDVADQIAAPYLGRFFYREELPAILGGAQPMLSASWAMVGDWSVVGNFGSPENVGPCARFARATGYRRLADALEETVAYLDAADPQDVAAYFDYRVPTGTVGEELSHHLVEKFHEIVDSSEYFFEMYQTFTVMMQGGQLFIPVPTREALLAEVADLVDRLEDYETRLKSGKRTPVLDAVLAAEERFMLTRPLKPGRMFGVEVPDLGPFADGEELHLIDTTSGRRFGVVAQGRLRMIDPEELRVLAEVPYP